MKKTCRNLSTISLALVLGVGGTFGYSERIALGQEETASAAVGEFASAEEEAEFEVFARNEELRRLQSAARGSFGNLQAGLSLTLEERNAQYKEKFDELKDLRKRAENGNGDAALELFRFYDPFFEKVGDPEQALFWLKKAANAGNGNALNSLGSAYIWGEYGLDEDEAKGIECWKRAVEVGNTAATYNLVDSYQEGIRGVKKDLREALNWALKGYEANPQNYEAIGAIVGIYANNDPDGKEVRNLEEARKWVQLARDNKYYDVSGCFGSWLIQGKGVEQGPAEGAELLREAIDNGKDSMDGRDDAMIWLAACLDQGLGTEQDKAASIALLRQAIDEEESKTAMDCLGVRYYQGNGVEKDDQKAFELFQKSEYYSAAYHLAVCYLKGIGCEPNEEKALKALKYAWNDTSADPNDKALLGTDSPVEAFLAESESEKASSMNNIGHDRYFGCGIDADEDEALKWFEIAALFGNPIAMRNLGFQCCYRDEDDKAREWFLKSIDAGETIIDPYLVTRAKNVAPTREAALKWLQEEASAGNEKAVKAMEIWTAPVAENAEE